MLVWTLLENVALVATTLFTVMLVAYIAPLDTLVVASNEPVVTLAENFALPTTSKLAPGFELNIPTPAPVMAIVSSLPVPGALEPAALLDLLRYIFSALRALPQVTL